MSANQKFGIEIPKMPKTRAAESQNVPLWFAAKMPSSIPIITDVEVVIIASRHVVGHRLSICCEIGCPVLQETPKSPRLIIPQIYFPNCTRNGSFSPFLSRHSNSSSCVASSPRWSLAESPGVINCKAKMRRVTQNKTGIIRAILLIIYFSIRFSFSASNSFFHNILNFFLLQF